REGVDYVPVTGTVVFPAETTDPQFITVPIIGNLRHQPTHKVFLRLLNPVQAVLDGRDGVGDIVDDDPTPSVTISDVSVGEANSRTVNAVLTVTLSNDTDDVVTVNYSTLAPTVGTEFSGAALATGWTTSVITTGGGSTVANGSVTVDGASVLAPNTYSSGHTLEFVARFSGEPNQNVGFGLTSALIPPFAMLRVKRHG